MADDDSVEGSGGILVFPFESTDKKDIRLDRVQSDDVTKVSCVTITGFPKEDAFADVKGIAAGGFRVGR